MCKVNKTNVEEESLMKRGLAILLAVFMMLTITSCSGSAPKTEAPAKLSPTSPAPETKSTASKN